VPRRASQPLRRWASPSAQRQPTKATPATSTKATQRLAASKRAGWRWAQRSPTARPGPSPCVSTQRCGSLWSCRWQLQARGARAKRRRACAPSQDPIPATLGFAFGSAPTYESDAGHIDESDPAARRIEAGRLALSTAKPNGAAWTLAVRLNAAMRVALELPVAAPGPGSPSEAAMRVALELPVAAPGPGSPSEAQASMCPAARQHPCDVGLRLRLSANLQFVPADCRAAGSWVGRVLTPPPACAAPARRVKTRPMFKAFNR